MRLTTNTPQGNLEQSLNLFYAKDGETWVRGYGEHGADITLLDLTRKLIRQYAQPDEVPETMSDEDVMFAMVDWLYGGTDSMEGVLALLYLAGWVCAELLWRCMRNRGAHRGSNGRLLFLLLLRGKN